MTYQQEGYQNVNNVQQLDITAITLFYCGACLRKGYNLWNGNSRGKRGRTDALQGVERGITKVMDYNQGYTPSLLRPNGGISNRNPGCHETTRRKAVVAQSSQRLQRNIKQISDSRTFPEVRLTPPCATAACSGPAGKSPAGGRRWSGCCRPAPSPRQSAAPPYR